MFTEDLVEGKQDKVTEHENFGEKGIPIPLSVNFVYWHQVRYHVKADSDTCWKHRLQHNNKSHAFVAYWLPTDLHHLAGFDKDKDFLKIVWKHDHIAYPINIIFFIAKEIPYLIIYQ